MQVNRYLDDKAMDYIDHALGRPVDPLAESYRNYFYVTGGTELRREFTRSPHWVFTGCSSDGEFFAVTTPGRKALSDHLKAIGDRHRVYIVSWGGYDTPVVATSAAKARYSRWVDISDCYADLTFAEFQKTAKVRNAAQEYLKGQSQ